MAGSIEDIFRGITSGAAGFFGWDTPSDASVGTGSVAGTAPATSAASQPQTVAPVGDGGGSVLGGVPTWALIAGGLLAVGVVVALVSK